MSKHWNIQDYTRIYRNIAIQLCSYMYNGVLRCGAQRSVEPVTAQTPIQTTVKCYIYIYICGADPGADPPDLKKKQARNAV